MVTRESGLALGRVAVASGIAGPLLLVAYFAAPALLGWPYAGASAVRLSAYAESHATLFYAGAWLQVTGTVLSTLFFVALVQRAGALDRIEGLLVIVGSTTLLAIVLVEAAFLVAVPMAAASGDLATVATSFALSNGVFVRIFPLAPSSATYIALGLVLLRSGLLPRGFARASIAIGAAFEVAGFAAIFMGAAMIAIAVLAAGQSLWVVAAAAYLGRKQVA